MPAARLFPQLVPSPLWGKSLSRFARRHWSVRKLWKIICEKQRSKAGGRCQTCGSPGQLVHEQWEYDEHRRIQRLTKFVLLCELCNLVVHLGYSGVQGKTGEALKQMIRINGISQSQAMKMVASATDEWARRSQIEDWTQDFSIVRSFGRDTKDLLSFLGTPSHSNRGTNLFEVPLIGPTFRQVLRQCGISTVKELLQADIGKLSKEKALQQASNPAFAQQISLIRNYAMAIVQGSPVVTSTEWPGSHCDSRKIMFVDLEYDPETSKVFVIGTARIEGKIQQWFIENDEDAERKCIQSLLQQVLGEDLKLVCFASKSADFAVLKKAVRRLGLEEAALRQLSILDLFYDVICTWSPVRQVLFLPVKPMTNGEIAEYFGYRFPANLSITDGLEVLEAYKKYLRSHSSKLRTEILRYNRCDLEMCAVAYKGVSGIFERMGSIS